MRPRFHRGLWFKEAPLQLRPAPAPLTLPLLPSPRLRLAGRVLSLGVLLYLLELALTGHGLAAGMVALIAACTGWPWRQWTSSGSPRHLVVTPDGRLFLRIREDSMEEMRLRPESLRLGPHVLLVLSNGRRKHRLLLGPDNLTLPQLSALTCRLPAGPAPSGTALHSPAAPRRSSPP
jgi:hypothetical protein